MYFRYRNWRYAEILAETLLVLALCNDLAHFLLRLTFPRVREIRTDIRLEMADFEDLLWIDTNSDYCFWLRKAAAWIPINVTCPVPTGVSPLTFLPEKADYLLPARLITASLALPTGALWILLIYSVFVNIGTWSVQLTPDSMLTARFRTVWHYIFALPLLILYVASVWLPPLLIVKVTIWLSTAVFGESAILWASSGALIGLIFYCVVNLCGIVRIPSRIRFFYKSYLTDRRLDSQPLDRSGLLTDCCRSVVPRLVVCVMLILLVVFLHIRFPENLIQRASQAVFPPVRMATSVVNASDTNASTAKPIMLDETDAQMSYWVDLRRTYDNATYHDLFPNGSNELTTGARTMGAFGYFYSGIFASVFFVSALVLEFGFVIALLIVLGWGIWSCFSASTSRGVTHAGTTPTKKKRAGDSKGDDGMFLRDMLYSNASVIILSYVVLFGIPMGLEFLIPERMYLPAYVIITLLGIIGSAVWLLCLCVRARVKSRKEDVGNADAALFETGPVRYRLEPLAAVAGNKA